MLMESIRSAESPLRRFPHEDVFPFNYGICQTFLNNAYAVVI